MEKLHSKYVFTPAGNAAAKFIITWKRYYVDVLRGQLNSSSTYIPAHLTNDKFLLHHINTFAKINVKIDKCELTTFYWLPKLHKKPYKSRFRSNSSHCSTTILSKHITSALTTVKIMLSNAVKLLFKLAIVILIILVHKNSSDVIEKLRLFNFQGIQVSSFDFSTLYTSLPPDLIKENLLTSVLTESQNVPLYLRQSRPLSIQRYESYNWWTCAE